MKNEACYKINILNEKTSQEKEIILDVDYKITNDGIGSYEIGDQKCFDKGEIYADIISISYDKGDLTPEEIELVEKEIDLQIEDISFHCFYEYNSEIDVAREDAADADRKYDLIIDG